MTPSDFPTYMREILLAELRAFKYADRWTTEIELLAGGATNYAIPTEPVLAAMHRVYLDRDEGSSLRAAKEEIEALSNTIDGQQDVIDRLKPALILAAKTLRHARVFIGSRNKMHPDGITLYEEAMIEAESALSPNSAPRFRHGRSNHVAPDGGRTGAPPETLVSPAQRSSLPLPDRERTAGRDDLATFKFDTSEYIHLTPLAKLKNKSKP